METFVERIDEVAGAQVVQDVSKWMAVSAFHLGRWRPSQAVIAPRSFQSRKETI